MVNTFLWYAELENYPILLPNMLNKGFGFKRLVSGGDSALHRSDSVSVSVLHTLPYLCLSWHYIILARCNYVHVKQGVIKCSSFHWFEWNQAWKPWNSHMREAKRQYRPTCVFIIQQWTGIKSCGEGFQTFTTIQARHHKKLKYLSSLILRHCFQLQPSFCSTP